MWGQFKLLPILLISFIIGLPQLTTRLNKYDIPLNIVGCLIHLFHKKIMSNQPCQLLSFTTPLLDLDPGGAWGSTLKFSAKYWGKWLFLSFWRFIYVKKIARKGQNTPTSDFRWPKMPSRDVS